jgi:hypothetical protein
MMNDVVDESKIAVNKIIPGAELVVQAALQEGTIYRSQSHLRWSLEYVSRGAAVPVVAAPSQEAQAVEQDGHFCYILSTYFRGW